MSIIGLNEATAQRYTKIAPSDIQSKCLYAIGDCYFDESDVSSTLRDPIKFKQCLKYYILATAQETNNFTNPALKIPRNFYTVIRRLITSLHAMKAHIQCIILCQFLTPIDYSLAFKIIQENAPLLDTSYFQYIWEVPILELLICIL